jgi:hypothetical protein
VFFIRETFLELKTCDLVDRMKDRIRRPEGGEWEPIKIPLENLAYVPNQTQRASLLARSRPHSY